MTDLEAPLGGWTPSAGEPAASVSAATAAGGLATWLPDGRWSTPAELAAPPPEPPGRSRHRIRRSGARDAAGRPRPRSAPDVADADRQDPTGRRRPVSDTRQRDATAGRAGPDRARRRRVAVVRGLARWAGWPRRVAAAGFALAALVLLLRPGPAEPVPVAAPGATVPVVVVARDLPAGTTLTRTLLRTAGFPSGAVPAGAARAVPSVLGRVVAGPVRRGEALTDARLLGPGLTAGLDAAESTATPVRLADPDTASLVRPGDRVDVLGTPVQGDGGATRGDAVTLATAVRVLAVVRGRDAADGVLLVVATTPPVARRLAGAAAGHRLTVAVRPP